MHTFLLHVRAATDIRDAFVAIIDSCLVHWDNAIGVWLEWAFFLLQFIFNFSCWFVTPWFQEINFLGQKVQIMKFITSWLHQIFAFKFHWILILNDLWKIQWLNFESRGCFQEFLFAISHWFFFLLKQFLFHIFIWFSEIIGIFPTIIIEVCFSENITRFLFVKKYRLRLWMRVPLVLLARSMGYQFGFESAFLHFFVFQFWLLFFVPTSTQYGLYEPLNQWTFGVWLMDASYAAYPTFMTSFRFFLLLTAFSFSWNLKIQLSLSTFLHFNFKLSFNHLPGSWTLGHLVVDFIDFGLKTMTLNLGTLLFPIQMLILLI